MRLSSRYEKHGPVAIKAPFLPYDKLRVVAAEFLAEHHPSVSIPIPIESIIERHFEMDIIPMPGMIDAVGSDSSISRDLTTIYVDEGIYKHRYTRYRFSIAHELSHRLIHGDIFAQLDYSTLEGWKAAVGSIPEEPYGWIEHQAYGLAGLILVPEGPLEREFELVVNLANDAGVDLFNSDAGARSLAESQIARRFEVSPGVIQRRLKIDALWNR